jgi:signal transduction histidine kinase
MPTSVLVVEDDADIREALSGLLTEEGYSVNVCANGLDALTYLRAGRPADVIVLDLMMPVMDGWQFRVLQKRDPELAPIPVLALSADGTPKAAAIDAAAYLKKPVSYEALLNALERTLLSLERKKLQATSAETERLAALGTLAAGVAHEINNPLAYVSSNVSYAARVFGSDGRTGREKDAGLSALSEADDGCRRIRAIVGDLQLFSRAPDDERRAVDVHRALDASANIVMHEIRPRARLVKDYGDVPRVMANDGRLAQLFSNLILNAAQAIPEGNAGTNEIRLVTRADESWVTIEVRDTGAGIPEDVLGRIFEPFFTTKPVGVGTGLGLSIAHKIVTAAGGEIRVTSGPAGGTAFRVRLPVAQAPASAPLPARTTHRRARILVIDDDPMIGAVLKRVLDDAHDVESTTQPQEAIARLRAGERFDLILCDMMMPEMTGIEVHAEVSETLPDQATRMMFLTGGATSARARAFVAQHAGRIVEKPFVTADLVARIDASLASLPSVSAAAPAAPRPSSRRRAPST